MSEYIGPKQRPIIDALKAGGELRMRDGRWRLWDKGVSSSMPRDSCMGLYTRGFIMFVGHTASNKAIYRVTEKGKRV
jgi:hypothetical protein